MVPLRIAIRSGNQAEGTSLRFFFNNLPNAHLTGEVQDWEAAERLLSEKDVDILVVELDGAAACMEAIAAISSKHPQTSIIGISEPLDPQSIIAFMRAGCNQIVFTPIHPPDLRDAVERLCAGRASSLPKARRVCVVGSSGGVGTTTIVCNLALELARLTASRIGIADLNLEFGDTACAFDCEPTYTVADVCNAHVEIDEELLSKALCTLPSGVSLLATPRNLADALTVTPEGVERMLVVMDQMFSSVIVDLPRAYSFLTATTLQGTARVLIVTQLSVPIVRNAQRIHESLIEMGVPSSSIEVVINRAQASFEQLCQADLEAHFGRPVFAVIPNDYRRFRLSMDLGHPLNEAGANSPARVAIHHLARKLVGNEQPNTPPSGLLGKFWRRSPKIAAQ